MPRQNERIGVLLTIFLQGVAVLVGGTLLLAATAQLAEYPLGSMATTSGNEFASGDAATYVEAQCPESKQEFYYVRADQFNMADIIGANAYISTYEPLLDCEGADVAWHDHSLAWVCVSHEVEVLPPNAPNDRRKWRFWAQTGYSKVRKPLQHPAGTYWTTFAENMGANHIDSDPPNYVLQFGLPPASGDHLYSCNLDPATGEWTYYYDNAPWAWCTQEVRYGTRADAPIVNLWQNFAGNAIGYATEIFHHDTQMVGDSNNKVRFLDCEYSTTTQNNVWFDVVDKIWIDDFPGTHDPAYQEEWGWEYDTICGQTLGFFVWDKKP